MPAFYPRNPAGLRAQAEAARSAEESAQDLLRANGYPGAVVHRVTFEYGRTVALFTDVLNRPHRAYLSMRASFIRKGEPDTAPDLEVVPSWDV